MSEPVFLIEEFIKNRTEELFNFMISTIKQCYPSVYSEEVIEFFIEHHSPENLEKKAKKGIILLGFIENKMIACGMLHKKEICGVYVDPAYHRKGYGKILVSKLIQSATDKGFDHIWLDSTPLAYEFYLSLGFIRTGENTIYVRNNAPLHHFRMYKALIK